MIISPKYRKTRPKSNKKSTGVTIKGSLASEFGNTYTGNLTGT